MSKIQDIQDPLAWDQQSRMFLATPFLKQPNSHESLESSSTFHQNSPAEKRSWKLRHVPLTTPRNPTAGQGREQLKKLEVGGDIFREMPGKITRNSINGRQKPNETEAFELLSDVIVVLPLHRSDYDPEMSTSNLNGLLLATPGNLSWSMVIP